jgi:IS5 family transposase
MRSKKGIEKGRQVRVDCTCVETPIHHPTDSNLLWDGVRVLTRLIDHCGKTVGFNVPGFHNHTRVAKRRMLAVMNAKRKNKRKAAYVDLLKTSRKVVGYARKALSAINASGTCDPLAMALGLQIDHFVDLTRQDVIHQTERRVFMEKRSMPKTRWYRCLSRILTSSSRIDAIRCLVTKSV